MGKGHVARGVSWVQRSERKSEQLERESQGKHNRRQGWEGKKRQDGKGFLSKTPLSLSLIFPLPNAFNWRALHSQNTELSLIHYTHLKFPPVSITHDSIFKVLLKFHFLHESFSDTSELCFLSISMNFAFLLAFIIFQVTSSIFF